jgi:isopentenyl phosphate kinase
MSPEIYLVKLGGSVITDKTKAYSYNEKTVRTIGQSFAKFLKENPKARLIIGNGAGSFGHYAVHDVKYREDQADIIRASKVRQKSIELNKRITETLIDCGLPIFNMQPSAFLRRTPELTGNTDIVFDVVNQAGVPLVYGDIIVDSETGTSIASTETLLNYLGDEAHKRELECQALIYLTNVPGVLDHEKKVIKNFKQDAGHALGGGDGYDVTGGMAQKVAAGFEGLSYTNNVFIIDGKDPVAIDNALRLQCDGTALVR